jgi:purine-cytosine permease-like protein
MNESEKLRRRRANGVGIALLTGVLVPFFGLAFLLGAHPAESEHIPLWVRAALPFSFLGSDEPSVPVFIILIAANAVVWAILGYYLTRAAQRLSFPRKT